MNLTKDADEMVCVLYRAFLERRENCISKSAAKLFSHPSLLQKELFPEWYEDDIADTITELANAGFVKQYSDGGFLLQDSAIVYMEGRFGRKIDKLIEYVSALRP